MMKCWKKKATTLVWVGCMMTVTAPGYAQSITTMEQLQAQTDALIKSAQADMQRWKGAVQLADNKQKKVAMPKSNSSKQATRKQSQKPQYLRVPRGTRTAPTAGMTGTKRAASKSS